MSIEDQDGRRAEPTGAGPPLLRVRGLSVDFPTTGGTVRAVDGVSFSVHRGQTIGIVGESGAGKSASALALLGLLPGTARVTGSIMFDGRELVGLPGRDWRRLRGRRIAMAFTESVTALDPVRSVSDHLREAVRAHRTVGPRESRDRIAGALDAVGLGGDPQLPHRYPHQLSGGIRQRVMIAMAIVGEPELLVLDEPTSSLDVIAQARVLRRLADLRDAAALTVVLVTHDLAVAAALCDRIVVMRQGRIVEAGTARQVLGEPRDPYTVTLLRAAEEGATGEAAPARPPGPERPEPTQPPVLEVTDVVVRHPRRMAAGRSGKRDPAPVVRGVSLVLGRGESLGLVGRSGAGKTSLVRAIVQLRRPSSGSVRFAGTELTTASPRTLRTLRAGFQVVLQDPFASLDPRMSAGAIVAEPLRIHRRWRHGGPQQVRDLMSRVGLDPGHVHRLPHELSAGQRQRLALARALALDPHLLVLDEPVSSLDVVIRSEILALLAELRDSLGLAYLVISHDLSVVRRLCDRVSVMSRGRIVESGPVSRVFGHPEHPCTVDLLRAVPRLSGPDGGDAGR